MNIFTVDLEDGGGFPEFENEEAECLLKERFLGNHQQLYGILQQYNIKPTFFILASVARNYPKLVEELAQHYDIGTHGTNHKVVCRQSLAEFEADVTDSIKQIEEVTGKKVTKYRAPCHSLFQKEYFKVLANTPIEIDCSLSPVNHLYGKTMTGIAEPYLVECNGRMIKEMPPVPLNFLGKKFGLFGGGYFRLFPYRFLALWLRNSKVDYSMIYLHPSDFDSQKPLIEGISLSRRFKSYVGLKGAEKKLRQLLQEFDFTDVASAERMIDWSKVPIVRL